MSIDLRRDPTETRVVCPACNGNEMVPADHPLLCTEHRAEALRRDTLDMSSRLLVNPDRILVRPLSEEAASKLLWTPTERSDRPMQGTVLALGANIEDSFVRVGAEVLFSKAAGMAVAFGKRGEDKYLVLREADIMLIVLPEKDA